MRGNKKRNRIKSYNKGEIESDTSPIDDLCRKIEHSKYVFDLANKWIENTDNKVSISCAIVTGIYGLFSLLNRNSIEEFSCGGVIRWMIYVLFFTSVIAMATAFTFFIKALYPNTDSSGNYSQKYPIYYGDIARMGVPEYQNLVIDSNEIMFFKELINEIHINSRTCSKKIRNYQKALKASYVAVILAITCWIIQFIL